MTIKTYRPTNKPTGSLMEQHEHGDWVKASYAVMLEQQLASEKAETERFRALAENQTEAVKTYLAQLADSRSETARLTAELDKANTRAKSAEDRCERLTELGREVVGACHLRTHGFPEGDISDADFSKLTPAIVALDAELNPTHPGDAGKGGG